MSKGMSQTVKTRLEEDEAIKALSLVGKHARELYDSRMVTSRSKAHNKAEIKKGQLVLRIDKSMRVGDIVTLCPGAEPILAEYGLHCFHCSASEWENLDDGCRSHGFDTEEIDELVNDLNELLESAPARPQILTVTLAAAEAIRGVAASENKTGEGLAVIVDGHGGFCMEFRKDPEQNEKIFFHPEAADVRIFASTITLARIGGSTVDFRDGRFKLDVAEEAGCGCGGTCGCKKE